MTGVLIDRYLIEMGGGTSLNWIVVVVSLKQKYLQV